ncbi:MAG: PTS system mannose/fructose/N-acetylgalactosamine-transporter subunit IIB [Lachnospiraceae bacterium]|nr:PTS system mannose/fructose/N-acetylgalactosamine-transporter subunit IIB [Lachnospiraceae bacterium]
MATPNIVAFRIDERLIHGQGQLWIKALGCNTVIVANDAASEDPMQQMLIKAVVPKTIAMRFFSVQHTCDIIHKASPKQTIFIVCKTPEDALKLVAGGVPVKEINVGNIHHGPGKEEVSKYIALGEADKNALRTLRDQYGVTFNTQATASGDDGSGKVDLNKYL